MWGRKKKKNNAVKFSQLFCVLRNFTFLAGKKSVQVFLIGGHSGTAFYEMCPSCDLFLPFHSPVYETHITASTASLAYIPVTSAFSALVYRHEKHKSHNNKSTPLFNSHSYRCR